MSESKSAVQKMTLPSDQDATGRTLGDEEIAAVSAAIAQRHADQHQGNFVKTLEKEFAGPAGRQARLRLRLGHGGRAPGGRGPRPRAGRRDRHDRRSPTWAP